MKPTLNPTEDKWYVFEISRPRVRKAFGRKTRIHMALHEFETQGEAHKAATAERLRWQGIHPRPTFEVIPGHWAIKRAVEMKRHINNVKRANGAEYCKEHDTWGCSTCQARARREYNRSHPKCVCGCREYTHNGVNGACVTHRCANKYNLKTNNEPCLSFSPMKPLPTNAERREAHRRAYLAASTKRDHDDRMATEHDYGKHTLFNGACYVCVRDRDRDRLVAISLFCQALSGATPKGFR